MTFARDLIGETLVVPIPLSENPELRLLEESDAAEFHSLIEANRDYLARWLPWAAAQTFEDTAAFIRHTREQLLANNGFQLAILSEQRIAGVVGFHGVDWARRSTRIGYWLSERHQGQGTMTAGVAILVDHALSVWELERVEIRAAVENRRSRAVAERLGFREEDTLRAAEQVGERLLDQVVYAKLATAARRR